MSRSRTTRRGLVTMLAVAVGCTWGGALAVNRSLRRVEGDSMLPTLADGELVLTVPLRRRPVVGDVVVVEVPSVGATVKRVVAGPRANVTTDEGRLVVDGTWHDEPYATTADDGVHRLPADDGWVVLGDNRPGSTDSRAFGRVPREALRRRALVRVRRPRLLREAPVPRPGPRARRAARLLVLDDRDRVLLFRVPDQLGDGLVWMTPGGGLGLGEDVAAAATRELAEEVGLPSEASVVLDRSTTHRAGVVAGAPIAHEDHWVAVRVAGGAVDESGWTAYEREEISATRWFTAADLAALPDDEALLPPDLADLVDEAMSALRERG